MKFEIDLDTPILTRTQRLAEARGFMVEELLKQFIEQIDDAATAPDLVLGVFADEPALLDHVTNDAMRSREGQVLRQAGE